MDSLFVANLDAQIALLQRLRPLDDAVLRAGRMVADALAGGGKLMICGNGGSASDAQHIAAEMTGRFIKDRRPLAAVSLTTDTSALTSIANDYSFDDVFARQLTALARAGDCLLAISTSGNSKNVIRAVHAAKAAGVATIGLLGRDGGALKDLCDHAIVVPSDITARIQESHILIGHTLCGFVEQALGLA